ncbi:hypothetical protein U9M48_031512 [Paspalum notatum var. saurae]|uniref:Uncharacterized protein n=1 Tax=Paspalum notatum var. saurae TaxID=547442 RepID=A0AAQ3U7H8_PASNO
MRELPDLGEKSYADKRRRDLTFEVNDFVYTESVTDEGHSRIQHQGKVSSRVYWTIQGYGRRDTHGGPRCTGRPNIHEHPVKILDTAKRVTGNKRIKMCECGGSITRSERLLGKEKKR